MAAGRTILPPNSTGNAYVDDVYTATIDGTPTTVHQQRVGLYDASGNPVGGGDASAANQTAQAALTGAVNETAPATDIASSGLNGRLQRIAQRLTSLIALFPASLGQKLKATSFPVVIASDQDALTVTGTFFQATQPVSGTVTATGPLTDTQIRATALPVSGTVTANAGSGTMAVSGPLTDTQLRASALPVSGTLTANAGTGTMATSNAGLPSSLGQKTAAGSTSVVLAIADTLLDGTVTATTSAAALPTQACHKQTVQNDPSNTTDLYVGNATSQSVRLMPGASETFTVSNLNLIYVKAVSGTVRVNYHAEV